MTRDAELRVLPPALIIPGTRYEKSVANLPLAILLLEDFGVAIPLEIVMELS